jgi:hypothetical protein
MPPFKELDPIGLMQGTWAAAADSSGTSREGTCKK